MVVYTSKVEENTNKWGENFQIILQSVNRKIGMQLQSFRKVMNIVFYRDQSVTDKRLYMKTFYHYFTMYLRSQFISYKHLNVKHTHV